MTTRQTTAAATTTVPSEDIPSRMAHLEAQIQEVQDLLVTLTAAQTRIPSTPPVDTPIPTVEAAEQRRPRTRNTPETVQLPPLQDFRSPSIPSTSRMHTEDPPARYKKSTISERITPLSDRIEHTFLQWSASIRDLLVASASKPTRSTPALFTRTTFLPKPTMLERVKTAVPASSGNCFKCGKPGHFQDKCPLNANIKEIDRNDPEAEEQWEEAVELQSDTSLEENDEA
ncbi:hypothetical protein VC83_08765 [Pseudogymnoascus destructans]|uniref:CCHC-type domain-containing protein n=1 Tax=Pseudogymnoascus destructans TaxID=655981 RepID=A0A177A2A5_9PEZI|nr:uncharacterized protein VC83_08765 [Pseudogymnoascus destructans]OAF55064.1 hypothetical protein VC83_08765 [Pseudogymnoascus destructans]